MRDYNNSVDYISGMENDAKTSYKTKIGITLCSFTLPLLITGCGLPEAFMEGWNNAGVKSPKASPPKPSRGYIPDPNAPVAPAPIIVHVHVDNDGPPSFDEMSRDMDREINRLRRFNEDQRRKTNSVVDYTRRQLRENQRRRQRQQNR